MWRGEVCLTGGTILNSEQPFWVEELRLGPIAAVEIFTSAAPTGVTLGETLDHQSLPFEQIRDLIADKPLVRAPFERSDES